VKNNLGKTILFLLTFTLLQAEDFTYEMKVNKRNPYVKEPLLLTLDIQQTNKEIVLMFNFDLKKSEKYSFQRLDSKESDSYHNVQIRYEYLIYPLQEGKIDIEFELLKRITTDHSIAYSFAGDRDHVGEIITTDTKVNLPHLPLQVKPLPEGTQLVGDFTLTHEIKTHQAKPYEPLPLQIYIDGEGYPPLLESVLPRGGAFTQFTEAPLVKSIASTKGAKHSVIYPMALSHDTSFTLPAIEIKAFNPETASSYMLSVPAQHFEIQSVDERALVDNVDAPEPFSMELSWMGDLLGYLIAFGAGFLTAITWKWQKKQYTISLHPLHEKIERTEDEKSLLQLLLAINDKQFSSYIKTLESSLYGDGKINFNKLKKEIQDQL
jgi:hypothetical protein